jgi:LuxR family transcriptional regulator, maltose regulon positive regulatory protein
VLGGREGWPSTCLEAGCGASARYCIPLTAGGRVLGVASAAFHGRVPRPLPRTLPAAFWLMEDLALADGVGEPRALTVSLQRREARLRIRCFGEFGITLEGRPVGRSELGRTKARELLSLLVVAEGRPVGWQQLAEELWPEAERAAARNRFHVTLAALRSALEPGSGGGWSYLRREGQRYFLDPAASLFVDVWHFQDLIRRADSPEVRRLGPESVLFVLEEAAALYAGVLFGDEFATSSHQAHAARTREAVIRLLARLAELRSALGDPGGAIAALRQAEAIDPCREDLQRELMRVLHAQGRRSEAMACYQRLRNALATGYGLEPSAETDSLYQGLVSPL